MKYSIACSLMALALYSLCSQGLAWALILAYSHPGGSLASVGALSAAGAFGLAIGQCINLVLLFTLGSHRLVTLASLLLLCLFPLSALSVSFHVHILARFILGGIDGMIFLVIENALVIYSSAALRASALAAYLFTLYAMQLFSPFFASALLDGNIYVLALMLCSAICAPCAFYFTPSFLSDQEPSKDISLGETQFVRQGFVGALLCALSGMLLSLWTAFIPTYLQVYPMHLTKMASLFLLGGLAGQVLVISVKKYCSSHSLTYFFLILGSVAAAALISPLAHVLQPLCILLFLLAFTLYPLYGLGLDLALEKIAPSLWVRANKTLLSCYTLPAIASPLLFPLLPCSPFIALPLVTGLGLLLVLVTLLKKSTKIISK